MEDVGGEVCATVKAYCLIAACPSGKAIEVREVARRGEGVATRQLVRDEFSSLFPSLVIPFQLLAVVHRVVWVDRA